MVLKSLFYLYVIVILFLATSVNNSGVDTGGDTANHILAFIVYAILFHLSFKKSYIYLFISGLFFGSIIELIQYFLPYRSCDFKDLVMDLIGLIIGFFIAT